MATTATTCCATFYAEAKSAKNTKIQVESAIANRAHDAYT